MNLSVIERMVKEGDLSKDAMNYLINCRCECAWLDYKEEFYIEEDWHLCSFAKDILALKNVGGGYILVGVQDKTWIPLGISTILPYDSKMIRDKIRRATDLDLDVHIIHHKIDISGTPKLFALIYVRSSRKRNRRRAPTLVKKDFCVGLPYGLRRGEIYIRRGDSTDRVQSEQELMDLLESLEEQSDQDAMSADAHHSSFVYVFKQIWTLCILT